MIESRPDAVLNEVKQHEYSKNRNQQQDGVDGSRPLLDCASPADQRDAEENQARAVNNQANANQEERDD